MWCAVSKLIHTLLSLVALQAHDICNRLACLGLFPSFIFSFFPPFLFLDGVSPHLAPTCGNHSWSLSLSFHLCAGRTWLRFVPFRPFSFCFSLLLVAVAPASLFFYCLLLFYYYRNSTLLARPLSLFAPLFMPRCGRHYFSSASCKINKTHTQAHSHVHTKLADELTDN